MTRALAFVAAMLAAAGTAQAVDPPTLGTVAPFNGSAYPQSSQTMVFTPNYPSGTEWVELDVVISTQGVTKNACYFVLLDYPTLAPVVYLFDDNALGWSPVRADSSDTQSNSHCQIRNVHMSNIAGAVTLSVDVTFLNSWAGCTLHFWEQAVDNTPGQGANSGWWGIPDASFQVIGPNYGPPQLGTVSPSSGIGAANSSQILQFSTSDPNGWNAISEVDILISPNHANSGPVCFMVFFNYESAVYLFADNGVDWSAAALGSGGASNNQCEILGPGSSYTGAGSGGNLTLNMKFSENLLNANYFDEQVGDQLGNGSGWGSIAGSFTVRPGLTFMTDYYLPGGAVGSPYSQSVSLRQGDGVSPYTWTVSNLPPEFSINSGNCSNGPCGVLIGTPMTPGTAYAYITVTDSSSTPATKGMWFLLQIQAQEFLEPTLWNVSSVGYPFPLCGSNCFAGQAYIKYFQNNNQLFGEALSYYEGPGSSNIADVTAFVSMVDDLRSVFSDACGVRHGVYYPNLDPTTLIYYPYVVADSVAPTIQPCSPLNINLLQPSADRSYSVISTHSDSADGSHYNTLTGYFGLAFMAAGTNSATGTNSPFNGVLLPAGFDYTKLRSTPVVYTAQDPGNQNYSLANDGVTVSYNSLPPQPVRDGRGNIVAYSASIRVSVPYSARKGRHDISFAFDSAYSTYTNIAFAVIVYDSTPNITSVSGGLLAGMQTSVILNGTGFGDKPNAYLSQTSSGCGPSGTLLGSFATNHDQATGTDKVTVLVTVPASWSPGNAYICLVSAGAQTPGQPTQAFIGKPQAATAIRGPRESNLMQVAIKPVISNFSPNPIQIDGSGNTVAFTITGLGFGAGVPTLTFSPSSGVSIQSVNPTTNGGTTVTGTLLPQTGGSYTLMLTPFGGNQSSSPAAITLLPGPPTISGVSGDPLPGGIWWFYGGFVPNNGYYDSIQLAVNPGPGGSPPTSSQPARWMDAANPALTTINCNDLSCRTVTVYSNATIPGECPAASLMVTLGGKASTPISLVIDSPYFLALVSNPSDGEHIIGGQTGYASDHVYSVISACGTQMPAPAVNEQFPGQYGQTGAQGSCTMLKNNWPFIEKAGQTVWSNGNANYHGVDFVDSLITLDFPPPDGVLDPRPKGPQTPLLEIPLIWQLQIFRVGSETIGEGVEVHQDYQTSYQDHGRNQGVKPCN